MTAAEVGAALEQGGMSAIALFLLAWMVQTLQKRLTAIEKRQRRTNSLLAKVLRELGVAYEEEN